jgi:hypothetical protein
VASCGSRSIITISDHIQCFLHYASVGILSVIPILSTDAVATISSENHQILYNQSMTSYLECTSIIETHAGFLERVNGKLPRGFVGQCNR